MDQHFSDILGIFKRLDEATGDAGFDKMMSKIQDPKAAKTNLALGKGLYGIAHNANDSKEQQFFRYGDSMLERLEHVARKIHEDPVLEKKYKTALDNQDFDAVWEYMCRALGTTHDKLFPLEEILQDRSESLINFLWAYIEGHFAEDYLIPWQKYKQSFADLGENTMQQAARKPTGPNFVGKAPGVSTAAQAKSKLVGGCEESAIATNYTQGPKIDDSRSTINGMNEQERKLFVRYQRFLGEYGPTTSTVGSTGTGTNAVDATKAAKELQNTQQNLNKLKSAGVNMPKGVGTTAKSTMNTANNPNATTPTGMNAANQTDKGVAMNMGAEMEKLVATGKPAQVQQVANAIKQAKTVT